MERWGAKARSLLFLNADCCMEIMKVIGAEESGLY